MRKVIKVSAVAVFLSQSLFADTYTWTAGASGDFETLSNWTLASTGAAPEVLPGTSDDVVLPNADAAYTVTVNEVLNIGTLTVGGGTASAYPTLNFNTGTALNEVAGAVVVESGATLTHALNNSATVRKLSLKASTMTVNAGGKVSADCVGPFYNGTPSRPSHGGVGGLNTGLSGQTTYGSIREPTELGGCGTKNPKSEVSYKSGGAIYLEIANELVVNGTISALSKSGSSYYNGSGGSIYLKTGTLTGTGTIDASAGWNSVSAGGGGGRIAVYESATSGYGAFAGVMKAWGGQTTNKGTRAGCGTIYIENAGDTPGEGTLIIDNGAGNSKPYNTYCAALLHANVTDAQQPFGTVIVKNNAYLRIPSGVTLSISKKLQTTSGGSLVGVTGSTVAFVGDDDMTVEGANSFYSLICTVPGKKITFGTGSANKTSIKTEGSLTLRGAEGNPVLLRSAEEGTHWQLSIGTSAVQDITYCDVEDSDASSGDLAAGTDSVDSGNNVNWQILSGTPDPGELITWTGTADTDWTNLNNWDLARVPIATDHVLIPAGCANYPVIASVVEQNSITNLAGGTLSISGADLTVTNAFANFGTFTAGADDTLYLSGDGEMPVDLNGSTYNRITISKVGGGVNFVSGFSAAFLRCRTESALALAFAPGEVVDVDQLSLYGISANDAASRLITLSSLVQGSKWLLKATKFHHLPGTTVSDCDATQGAKVIAGELSTDAGGNLGWDFSAGAAAEWIGANGNMATAANWLPAGVPGIDAHVMICPPPGSTWSPTASSALSFRDIVMGCAGGTSLATFSGKVTLSEGIYLGEYSTLALNAFSEPNVVSNEVIIAKRGVLTHSGPNDTGTAKLNLEVLGDFTIKSGGSVSVKGKGYTTNHGPGCSGSTYGSSYASRGINDKNNSNPSLVTHCYGSALTPFDYGSGAGYGPGGGAVKIVATGDVVLEGTIDASGGNASHIPGTGGSIYITCAELSGGGTIKTDMGPGHSSFLFSSGGRIAIYQSEVEGWENFTGSVSYRGRASGTFYREDITGKGELFIDQSTGTNNGTQLPMASDGNALRAYAHVAVNIGLNSRLMITNATSWTAGSTIKVRDLDLTASSARVNCLGSVIKVGSVEHRKGALWVPGDYATLVESGAVTLGDGGKIVWPAGMAIVVK